MKKIVSTILSVLVLNSTLFSDDMAEKIQIQNQEIVKLVAEELTSQLPQKIDEYTKRVI